LRVGFVREWSPKREQGVTADRKGCEGAWESRQGKAKQYEVAGIED
jgi:hypothetical protein